MLKRISGAALGLFFVFNISVACAADSNKNNVSEQNSISCDTNKSTEKNEKKIIDVPYIDQSEIVYGCEAVSSTMLLNHYGYDIDEKDFTDNYLIKKDWSIKNGRIYGPDPDAAFPGNPYISGGLNCGFGSYAPSTAKSINKILDNSKHRAISEKGLSLNKIVDKYIKNDTPVLIWATMDMKEPKKTTKWIINYVDENSKLKIGDKFTWLAGEHCLVLVGYDNENYYFNDPYKNHGLIAYNKSLVEKRYKQMGSQCVHIDTAEDTETSNGDTDK